MKCSCCGKTNQIKTKFEIFDYCDGAPYIPDYVDVYLCLDCGHYDFFSKQKVEEYKQIKNKINAIELKIKSLEKDIKELESPDASDNINKKIENLESLLNDPSTLEEEKELFEAKLYQLIDIKNSIPDKINKIKKEICELENFLHREKLRLKYESL